MKDRRPLLSHVLRNYLLLKRMFLLYCCCIFTLLSWRFSKTWSYVFQCKTDDRRIFSCGGSIMDLWMFVVIKWNILRQNSRTTKNDVKWHSLDFSIKYPHNPHGWKSCNKCSVSQNRIPWISQKFFEFWLEFQKNHLKSTKFWNSARFW